METEQRTENLSNPTAPISPGDRVFIVNWKKTSEKYAIVTKVKPDLEFGKRVFIRFKSTGRNSWRALYNVSKV